MRQLCVIEVLHTQLTLRVSKCEQYSGSAGKSRVEETGGEEERDDSVVW